MSENEDNARELIEMEELYHTLQADAMTDEQIEKALSRFNNHIREEQKPRKMSIITHLRRIAAVMAIIIVAGCGLWLAAREGLFNSTRYVTAYAADSITLINLPDGSRVWLNRHASLRYPATFDANRREVSLIGEGYFEVAKNKTAPFTVTSTLMSVRVLGTVFNFRVDENSHTAEVSLIEGSVIAGSNVGEGVVELTPGQKACLDEHTGLLRVEDVNAAIDAVWHDNIIPFHNATVREIADILEKLYHVRVYVDEKATMNATYSGNIIRKNDIDSVLTLLKSTIPMRFVCHGSHISIHPLAKDKTP